MQKIAAVDYPIHQLIRWRWSPRAFSSVPVEAEKIRSLLEAARWAASCFNEQPWFFIIATRDEPEDFARLLDCLVARNQSWAKDAPLLMLSVAKLTFDRNNKPNRHALHDVGQAVATMALQATAMNLFIHQMAGFDVIKARDTYCIPEGFEPVAAIAAGYAGNPNDLPEDLREGDLAPRERRPPAEFVFSGTWGKTAAQVTRS